MKKFISDETSSIHALKTSLIETGIFNSATHIYLLKFSIFIVLFLGFFYFALMSSHWVTRAFSSIFLGFISLQIGFIAHDAGHSAVSKKRNVNLFFGHLCFSIINGLGFNYWKASHNAHHKYCQVLDVDPDMKSDFIVSLNESHFKEDKGWIKYILPFQAYYFWFITFLFAHKLRLQTYPHLISNFKKSSTDLLSLSHYFIWLVLPALVFNIGYDLIFINYVISSALMGLTLIGVFSINHLGMPLFDKDHDYHFLQHQIESSRNVSSYRFFDFYFGGLNYQIEHHLFPSAPSMYLNRGSKVIKEFCINNGLKYHEESYISALKAVTRHIHKVAKSEKLKNL